MKISFRTSLSSIENNPFGDYENDILVLWAQIHKIPIQFGWKFRKFKRDFSVREYIDVNTGENKEGLCQTAEIDMYRFVFFPKKPLKRSQQKRDIFWHIPSKIITNVPIKLKKGK